LEDNLFRGQSRDIGTRYVFGGQVLGQALSAAQRTVDPARQAHSLHGYFLRAGDIEAPIVYQVERARDGRSFSLRRVLGVPHGRVLLTCAVSRETDAPACERQSRTAAVPTPADCGRLRSRTAEHLALFPVKLQRWPGRESPCEFRKVWARNEFKPEK